ncbi:immunoglobulin I-set domain protein, partial [Opisthorchis viverrini]
KPRIVRAPSSIATIAGQSALFVCLVEGNPAPKVQWKVSGTAVSEEHFGKTARAPRGSVLRVTNTLPNYNGAVITCTATNALGRAEESATLTVYADESAAPAGYPQFLNSFSVIVAKKNAGAELECRATGDPQPEISWFKNSVPVDMGNPRFTQLPEGNLKISNLIEDDEGKYECAATNDKGTRLSSGDNLLVRAAGILTIGLINFAAKRFRPHFTNRPPARQIVSPGGRLSLTCTAVGAPVPTVDWYRGTRKMQREQLDKQPPGTAKILLLDLSESVNVTCVAESTMGRIYHDVQVLVK